jgi:hypothetical protein
MTAMVRAKASWKRSRWLGSRFTRKEATMTESVVLILRLIVMQGGGVDDGVEE